MFLACTDGHLRGSLMWKEAGVLREIQDVQAGDHRTLLSKIAVMSGGNGDNRVRCSLHYLDT